MKNVLVVALLAIAACGGKNKNDSESGGSVDPNATSGDPTDRSGSMVPPEKMDEVNSALGRKQMIMSHCLATAVETGEVKKGTHGKIALEITISAAGQATKVDVIEANSSIQSKTVQGCVKKHVEEITFPQLPKSYETSYTYSMEAN